MNWRYVSAVFNAETRLFAGRAMNSAVKSPDTRLHVHQAGAAAAVAAALNRACGPRRAPRPAACGTAPLLRHGQMVCDAMRCFEHKVPLRVTISSLYAVFHDATPDYELKMPRRVSKLNDGPTDFSKPPYSVEGFAAAAGLAKLFSARKGAFPQTQQRRRSRLQRQLHRRLWAKPLL